MLLPRSTILGLRSWSSMNVLSGESFSALSIKRMSQYLFGRVFMLTQMELL